MISRGSGRPTSRRNNYHDTIEKYDKVQGKKHAAVQATLAAPSGELRLSRMEAEQLKRHERRTRKQRKVFSVFGFAVRAALAPTRFLKRLGGRASVFLAPGVDRTQATACQTAASKSVCSCYEGTLPDFVHHPPDAIGSRCVIIVPSLPRASDDCVMAAMLLGAQLAEHVLVPGLHFKKITSLKVMCTQQFAEEHRPCAKCSRRHRLFNGLNTRTSSGHCLRHHLPGVTYFCGPLGRMRT